MLLQNMWWNVDDDYDYVDYDYCGYDDQNEYFSPEKNLEVQQLCYLDKQTLLFVVVAGRR